ncbi:unnamed protein product [Adineta steineri]|uniref:Uncharacterized protein n=1 Tax=Adineta steineri TaxID=433720 RepID=A0A818SP79_9BILA|nr:unnamed protein product [Adineta steineri]CAF3673623.1 unnamed protein product [Adineta steineri]
MPMKWIHTNNWSGGYLNEQHMPFVPLPPSLTTGSFNSIRKNEVQFQDHSEISRLLSENEKITIAAMEYALENGIIQALDFNEETEKFYPGDDELWGG